MKKKSYHHYCDCAHPCMSFSTNKQKKSIQDWNRHSKGICQTKAKGKKGINPFCELGQTEDRNVLTEIWRGGVEIQKEVAGKQRPIVPSRNTL